MEFFTSNTFVVGVVIVIALFFFFFVLRFSDKAASLKSDLDDLSKSLEIGVGKVKDSDSLSTFLSKEIDNKELPSDLRNSLLRVRQRLLTVKTDFGEKVLSFESIDHEFRGKQLIENRLNLRLAEAFPGFFTGTGLLFTFIFLALALYGLGALQGTQALETVNQVLAAASAKFSTSIAGLIFGMWTTLILKKTVSSCEQKVDNTVGQLSRLISDRGAEETTQLQLELLSEVLNESREQVGQLKRFETDFAVSIAGAIEKVLSTRFESFSAVNNQNNVKLVEGLSGIQSATEKTGQEMAEKIGGINEAALTKMVGDLQSLVRETMTAEMEELRSGLTSLASDLRNSGDSVKQSITDAGSSFAESFKVHTLPVLENISRELATSAEGVRRESALASELIANSGKELSTKISESGAVLEGRIETAANFIGTKLEQGGDSLSQAIQSSGEKLESKLESAASKFSETFLLANGALSQTFSKFQTASQEMLALVDKSSVENVTVMRNLQESSKYVEKVFKEISENFKQTGETITGVIKGFEGTGKNLDQTTMNLNANTEKFLQAASSLDSVTTTMEKVAVQMSEGSQNVVNATNAAMEKFENMSKLLTRTNTELGVTLESMNTGLSTYSTKLRDLHQSLDQELAKAISGLEGTVGELVETLDEVSITFNKQPAKAA